MAVVNVMQPVSMDKLTSNETHGAARSEDSKVAKVSTEVVPASKVKMDQPDVQKQDTLLKSEYGSSITNQMVDDAIVSANESLETVQPSLQFERDQETDKVVIYMKNRETGEVLRQIPTNEFLQIAKNIDEYLKQVNESLDGSSVTMPVGTITNEIA